jgi:hypothetical protein
LPEGDVVHTVVTVTRGGGGGEVTGGAVTGGEVTGGAVTGGVVAGGVVVVTTDGEEELPAGAEVDGVEGEFVVPRVVWWVAGRAPGGVDAPGVVVLEATVSGVVAPGLVDGVPVGPELEVLVGVDVVADDCAALATAATMKPVARPELRKIVWVTLRTRLNRRRRSRDSLVVFLIVASTLSLVRLSQCWYGEC